MTTSFRRISNNPIPGHKESGNGFQLLCGASFIANKKLAGRFWGGPPVFQLLAGRQRYSGF